jgi:Tol biopolymer transport system component
MGHLADRLLISPSRKDRKAGFRLLRHAPKRLVPLSVLVLALAMAPTGAGRAHARVFPDGPRAERSDLASWGNRLVISQPAGLVTLDQMSGEVRTLIEAPTTWGIHSPAVSPDGASLAFTWGGVTGQFGYSEDDLAVTDAQGGGMASLFHPAYGGETAASPAWSPDGNWLYFVRTTAKDPDNPAGSLTAELVRVPAAGGTPEVLRPRAYSPSLSRDGKLAFVGESSRGSYAVFVSDAGAAQARQLTADLPYGFLLNPRISPDGRNIVFAAATSGPPPSAPVGRARVPPEPRATLISVLEHGVPQTLWVVSTSGGSPRRLASAVLDDPVPVWSPNGATIAYTTGSGVYAIAASGGPSALLSDSLLWGEIDWPP